MKKSKTYFEWLCSRVGRVQNYSKMLDILHNIDFYHLIPNDDNRDADGRDLRLLYEEETGQHGPSPLQNSSVLEMLIALSDRVEFDLAGGEYERPAKEWFWVLIDNLEWTKYTNFNIDIEEFVEKVGHLLGRNYDFNGNGGIFPLLHAERDQRKIEIWYQMSAWIIENYPI